MAFCAKHQQHYDEINGGFCLACRQEKIDPARNCRSCGDGTVEQEAIRKRNEREDTEGEPLVK